MKKELRKKIAVIVMSMTTMFGAGFGTVNTFAADSAKSNILIMKVEQQKNVGRQKGYATNYEYTTVYLSNGAFKTKPTIKFKNLKSSNPKIATVASKPDKKGYYKVTPKKKRKSNY